MSNHTDHTEGTVLWEPSARLQAESSLTRYIEWLNQRGHSFNSYHALWQWSVEDIEGFWASLWDFFDIQAAAPYTAILPQREMPGAKWFTGATLNYAQHVFRNASSAQPAIIFQSETQSRTTVTWAELEQQVGSIAAALK